MALTLCAYFYSDFWLLKNNVLLRPGACKNITSAFARWSFASSILVWMYSYSSFSFARRMDDPRLLIVFDLSAFSCLPPCFPLMTYFDSDLLWIISSFLYTYITNLPPWQSIIIQFMTFFLRIFKGSKVVFSECFWMDSSIFFCRRINAAGSEKSMISFANSLFSAKCWNLFSSSSSS